MKKFRFCALCLILAALLSACGRQAAQDVPGAAAVPSPAAVPEAPAESTSTPSPTAPAEIGKEFDDLSFLNEEQRQAYEGAYKLNYTLYGLPDNLVGVDVSPRFTQQSDNEGVFVLTVGNYALYENSYTDFTNLMQSVFTTDFIRRLGPLYTEKFIDLDGHLATSCDSVLACPMHDDLSRTVMDNCPDTYRLEYISVIHMCRGIKFSAIVLIPNTLAVSSNQRVIAFTISSNGDWAALCSAASNLEELLFKDTISHQQYAVARLKIQTVYGKQSRKCTILMQTIIFIITDFGIHIICLAQGYRTPPPAVSFQ